jgi:hypothetical protein
MPITESESELTWHGCNQGLIALSVYVTVRRKHEQFRPYLTSALDMAGSASRPDHFTLGGKNPWAPNIGRVGPLACEDALEKISYFFPRIKGCNEQENEQDSPMNTITRSANNTNRIWLPSECRNVSNNGPYKLLFQIHERWCKTIQLCNCFVLSPACTESQTREHVMQVTSITKKMRHTLQRDASIFSALVCRYSSASNPPHCAEI